MSTSVVQVLSYEGRAECDGCEHYVLRTVSEGAALDAAGDGDPREAVPRGLVAELSRVALRSGCDAAEVARMMVAGPAQARAVVEVAVTVAATVAEAARAAGGE